MNKPRLWPLTFIALLLTSISFGHTLSEALGYASFNSFPLSDVLMTIAVAIVFIMVRQIKKFSDSESHNRPQQNRAAHKLHLTARLLKLTGASEEERENIVGDLWEEFNEFDSRLAAYIWLYKQALKSVLPLAYKTIKGRLASLFDVRAR